jgi:AcrR family transcriptional regulator
MEDIAKRAGISKAAIYLYFASKTALLEALIDAKIAPLARKAETLAVVGLEDPLGALRLLARTVAQLMADPRVFAVPRLVIGISGRFPDIAEYYRKHTIERARGALEALFEAAMSKGLLRRAAPEAMVRAFIGPLFFEAMWTHVLGGESALRTPDALIEQHFDILLNGLENRA